MAQSNQGSPFSGEEGFRTASVQAMQCEKDSAMAGSEEGVRKGPGAKEHRRLLEAGRGN